MCFSSQASFVASGVLLPLGLYSVVKAFKANKRYILFSLIPLIFSIHQFIEGIIWDKIHSHPYTSLYQSILAFTFIAFFLWPIYIPMSMYTFEPQLRRKQILQAFAFLGFILSVAIYVPLWTGITSIDAAIVHDSISYPTDEAPYLQKLYTVAYITIIFLSLFISSKNEIKIFGIMLLLSFIFSILWFYFALTSVWCFFAAVLSTYIVYLMYKLPNHKKDKS